MWCKQTVLLVQIETCFTLQFQSKNNETLISWQDAATALYDKTLCVYCFQNKSVWFIFLLWSYVQTSLNLFNLSQGKNSAAGTKTFTKIIHVTRSQLLLQLVPVSCCIDLSPSLSQWQHNWTQSKLTERLDLSEFSDRTQ